METYYTKKEYNDLNNRLSKEIKKLTKQLEEKSKTIKELKDLIKDLTERN